MVSTYSGKKLELIDRRILRGLYLRKLRDYDEEIIDKARNMSLLQRLRGELMRPDSAVSNKILSGSFGIKIKDNKE